MKVFRKIILYITLSVFALLVIFLAIQINLKFITPLDYSYFLSEKQDTIEVTYVRWACDCANWLELKYFKNNPEYQTDDKDCIFIEPAYDSLQISDGFSEYEYYLRLVGKFYNNKGIARGYQPEFEKPDKAKVFRYTKVEMVKRK